MATLSDDLKLVLLVLGEEGYGAYTNYGDVENANWEIVEAALSGESAIAVTTADVTLTDAQQQSLYLNLTGTLTGNRSIILKASQKGFWFVYNNTSGAYTITVKPASGTGVEVVQGTRAIIYSDGSAASNFTPWSAKTIPTGTVVGTTDTQTLSAKDLVDSSTAFVDESDATKKFRLQVSGITTATTRTMTIPDYDFTVASLAGTETFTNKSLSDSTTYVIDNADATKKFQFQASGITTATTRTYTAPNKDGTMALLSDVAMMRIGLTSASDVGEFTITNLSSDYDEFLFLFTYLVTDDAAGTDLRVQLSTTNGVSYISTTDYTSSRIRYGTGVALAGDLATGATYWDTGVTSSPSGGNLLIFKGEFRLFTRPNLNGAGGYNTATATWTFRGSNATEQLLVQGGGDLITGSSPRVDAIKFLASTADDMFAEVQVYGRRNA